MVLLAVIASILTSFQACFHNYELSSFALGYVIDTFFIADIFIKMHTAYLQGGFWVVFPKEMRVRYVHSKTFIFDVIANFPYDLFVFLAYLGSVNVDVATMLTLVRLPKLMRTARVAMYFQKQEQKLHASVLIQSVKFIVYMFILTHTLACIWFALACPYGLESCFERSWISLLPQADGIFDLVYDTQNVYITSVYWTGIQSTLPYLTPFQLQQ